MQVLQQKQLGRAYISTVREKQVDFGKLYLTMRKKQTTLYLYVTNDKYELPLFVSEDPQEVARVAGTTRNSVFSSITRYEKKGIKTRFRRVKIND